MDSRTDRRTADEYTVGRTVSRNDSILSVLPVHTVGIGRLKDGEQE